MVWIKHRWLNATTNMLATIRDQDRMIDDTSKHGIFRMMMMTMGKISTEARRTKNPLVLIISRKTFELLLIPNDAYNRQITHNAGARLRGNP